MGLSPFRIQHQASERIARIRCRHDWQPPTRYLTFIDSVLDSVYRERKSLICDPARPPLLKPRSTERAIVTRMAVHADTLVKGAFTPHSVVDVEYERVGVGVDAKLRDSSKVSPYLIGHERSNPRADFLVVEVKCRGHKWGGLSSPTVGSSRAPVGCQNSVTGSELGIYVVACRGMTQGAQHVLTACARLRGANQITEEGESALPPEESSPVKGGRRRPDAGGTPGTEPDSRWHPRRC